MNKRVIELSKLVEGMAGSGYKDYQRPPPRKNFDFGKLDVKAIRILNRLTQHVFKEVEKFTIQNGIPGQLTREQNRVLQMQIMENLFREALNRVSVQAQGKDEKVYLI